MSLVLVRQRERHCESRVNLPHAYQHVCIISLHFVSHFLLFQPEETHLISSSGGLFTPEQVAANIVTGIKVWKSFFPSIGFPVSLFQAFAWWIVSITSTSTKSCQVITFTSTFAKSLNILQAYWRSKGESVHLQHPFIVCQQVFHTQLQILPGKCW